MLIRTIKAELKYCLYELKSAGRIHIVFYLLYAALYIYCLMQHNSMSELSLSTALLLIEIMSLYLFARMVLSGISLPYNVFYSELNSNDLIQKKNLYSLSLTRNITIRILLKFSFSLCLNIISFMLILSALNCIVDLRNYFIIIFLVIIGSIFMLSMGFVVLNLMIGFEIKREFLVCFHILFFASNYLYTDYNYFMPSSIFMTQIEGVISNDILYSQFNASEVLQLSIYWLALILVSAVIIYISNVILDNTLSHSLYKKGHIK